MSTSQEPVMRVHPRYFNLKLYDKRLPPITEIKFFGACPTDDIILLSASVGTLQTMLDVCYVSGTDIDIVFNAQNHVCLLLVRLTQQQLIV